jgi:hypothetical protein
MSEEAIVTVESGSCFEIRRKEMEEDFSCAPDFALQ